MTVHEYLTNLLALENLSEQQEKDLRDHKKEVTDFLREEFGDDPVIKYAGSREKGTMISDRYDLDIVCYFPSSDERSLKDIRGDVASQLAEKYLLTHKASSERILDLKGSEAPSDFHIDVVPGRFIEGTKDVFLHVAYGEKERMQTNLKVHINHIKDSGCVPIIRLAKLWAHRNKIEIKTFILELFVVKALSGYKQKGDLKAGFLKVLEEFKNNFTTTQLVDPANTNNVVSQIMPETEKALVAQAATADYSKLANSDEVDKWRGVFVDSAKGAKIPASAAAVAGIAYTPGSSFRPSKPWSGNYDYRG